MKKSVKIIPAILATNKTGFVRQWKKVAGHFRYMQIDIMDGKFVATKNSISPQSVSALTRGYRLEIHLMVKDVGSYASRWLRLKNVKKIIWHYEANSDTDEILALNKMIKSHRVKTGLAINPKTPLYKIKDLIPYFDTVQVMGVTPGKQGQRFHSKSLVKIKNLRQRYKQLNIAVDGGVNDKTFRALKKAGANFIVIGSYLQKAPNIKETLARLN